MLVLELAKVSPIETECQGIYDVIPDAPCQTTENKDPDNSYYAVIEMIESRDLKKTGHKTDAGVEDIQELNENLIPSSGDQRYQFTHCPAYESTTPAPTAHAQ